MTGFVKYLLYSPLVIFAVIILASWTFLGEVFLSFLPYIFAIYTVYLGLLAAFLVTSRIDLKRLNLFWFNWIVVFFIGLGIYSFYYDIGAQAYDDQTNKVKIVSANVWYKNDDINDMEEFFREEDADAIMLTELTEFQYNSLSEYLNTFYPYRIVQIENISAPYTGQAVFGKYPLIEENGINRFSEQFHTTRMRVGETEVDLLMVHTTAPISQGHFQQRNDQFNYLHEYLKNRAASNIIITGDFNISPWTPTFIKLGREMSENELQRLHNNKFDFSWEYKPYPFFKSQIDHTFVTNTLVTESYEMKDFPGSDHKAQVISVATK